METKNVLCALIIIIGIILLLAVIGYVIMQITKKEKFTKEIAPTYKKSEHDNLKKYNKVMEVKNLNELKDNFLWDNPNENGSDPTGGIVDYSYAMPKKDGKLIPNSNDDVSWSKIIDNEESKELLSNFDGGIKINLSKKLLSNNLVGAPRLISKKLFRGGLFIFDVEHVPIGCGVWPALWLNGFIGVRDQYHDNEKTSSKFKADLEKLAISTLGSKYKSKEGYDHTCKKGKTLNLPPRDKPNPKYPNFQQLGIDPILSEYTNQEVYPMEWPGGGEIDIVEQTNFSPTDLISVHGGPDCQISSLLDDTTFMADSFYGHNSKLRSVCGAKVCSDTEFEKEGNAQEKPQNGKQSCPIESVNSAGNSQINVRDGFGEKFNATGGGVFVTQWIPKEKIFVWFYPRSLFSETYLRRKNGPLSDDPNPDEWSMEDFSPISRQYRRTLVASYILNDKDAITDACDLNFQSIIINITLGGGWGGSSMPDYCRTDQLQKEPDYWRKFIPYCYEVDPESANNNPQGAWDPITGCYDGGDNSNFMSTLVPQSSINPGYKPTPPIQNHTDIGRKAVFYSEAYFKIRSLRVFQSKTDENVW